MCTDRAAEIRPRTTGEILDDAWRLALADAPLLLVLNGLFLVPAFAALLLLLARPEPAGPLARLGLPALTALLWVLTGLGSGSCQELFRRRAEGRPVSLTGCPGAALRQAPGHLAARSLVLAGAVLCVGCLLLSLLAGQMNPLVLVGAIIGFCLLLPGLMLWAAGACVHAVLAAGKGRPLSRELGREARFDPAKAAAVTLSRLPFLLLAAVNLHLLGSGLLWVANQLGGFDTALLRFEMSVSNGAYDLALLLLTWLLLSPYFEACNFLLHSDTRARQEGLDLLYRAQRLFVLSAKERVGALLFLAAGVLLSVHPLRAAEDERKVVQEVRAGVGRIHDEVKAADPYPGGRRWEGRLRVLGRRLEEAGDGNASRFRWFGQAVEGFARLNRDGALKTLEDLGQRLSLLEGALAPPRAESGGEHPRRTRDEIKRLLRREGRERPHAPRKNAEKREEPQGEEVRRDDPEPEAGAGRRSRSGMIAPRPAGGFGVPGWALLGGLVLAVFVVAGLLFWSARKGGPRPAKPARTSGTSEPEPEALPQPHERPAAEWWQEAEDLARGGRCLEAVRSLYLAVLSLLHRQHLLRYEPTRTNGEYVQQVRLAPQAPPDLHAAFAQLTGLFEGKWYGERACTPEEFDECRRLAKEVQQSVV